MIEAEEAEEIGVEHLLRDIRDVAVGTLSTRVTNQLQSLQGLHLRLRDIQAYLQKVLGGQLPVNHAILGNLQDVFNLLPDVTLQSFVRSVYVKTNDQQLVLYVASLVRAILALHNLINNKLTNRDAERNEGKDKKKDDAKDKKKDDEKDKKKDDKKEDGKEKKKEEDKEKDKKKDEEKDKKGGKTEGKGAKDTDKSESSKLGKKKMVEGCC